MSPFDPERTSKGRWQRATARAVRKRSTPPPYIPETLPTAAEVTSIAPSATPTRTSVRIHRRCRIYARCHIDAWCRIDWIFINHHWRGRYDDRPANHDDGCRLLDYDRRRRPVLVRGSFPPIAWNFAIGSNPVGHCRRGKNECACRTQDRFTHGRAPFLDSLVGRPVQANAQTPLLGS